MMKKNLKFIKIKKIRSTWPGTRLTRYGIGTGTGTGTGINTLVPVALDLH